MKYKKLLIGLFILIVIIGTTTAIIFSNKQAALDYIAEKKSESITINKSLVFATITDKNKCEIDYVSEEITGCKVCYSIFYNISNPIEYKSCLKYSANLTKIEIKSLLKSEVKSKIQELIQRREHKQINYLQYDWEGENITID